MLLLVALVLVASTYAEATARVCKTPDCSDIVGDHMMKDSVHTAKHFNSEYRAEEEHKKAARGHRSHINRRERMSPQEKKEMLEKLHKHHEEETIRIKEGRPSRAVHPSESLSMNGASGDTSDISE